MADKETQAAPKLADNQRTITVQGESFVFTDRYATGHVVNENEARALNQVLSENLRNNVAARVKDTDIAFTQDDFDMYAASYEFNAASARRAPLDPVEKEAVRIAKTMVAQALKAKDITVKDYTATQEGKDKYDANVAAVSANEKVIAMAKTRVQQAKELAEIKL